MNPIALSFVLIATVWLSNAYTLKRELPQLQAKTFNLQNKTNYVVYWGSTNNEGTLSDYCNDNIYDVIILAFAAVLDEDGVPQLYIDSCNGQDCSALISQVQSCQNNGKTIMLSVGGGAGYYILKSNDYAKKVAVHLWNMFLNGTGEKRPFGNGIVLDGVDFDIEAGTKESNAYWVTLINELRTLTKADTSKHYYLSGAPQCVLPDAWSVTFTHTSEILFHMYYLFF
jgi:chitinase